MSLITRLFPFLFEQDARALAGLRKVKNALATVEARQADEGTSQEDLRIALAGRLVSLLPDLDHKHQKVAYALCVRSLVKLAEDEITQVRIAVSSSLKDIAHFPPDVARKLAKDAERAVALPMLEYAMSVPDEDLIEVIKAYPEDIRVGAIAGRKRVSQSVSTAVIGTKNIAAGSVLIQNDGARISRETLQEIVASARDFPEWQGLLQERRKLPRRVKRQLHHIAENVLRQYLNDARSPIEDDLLRDDILETAMRRTLWQGAVQEAPAEERVKQFADKGQMNTQSFSDAIALGDEAFVQHGLAYLNKCDVGIVDTVFDSRSQRALVALCWNAGLPMRTAVAIQQRLWRLPQARVLLAKGGTDYPLSEDELKETLRFFEIKH